MKKTIICFLLLAIATTTFSQETKPSKPVTREEFLAKSKSQKSTGWILLGGGTALVGLGLLIGDSESSSFDDAATGAILGGIGVVLAIVSIPLFIASGRNHRKGMSLSLNNDVFPQPFKSGFISRTVPSVKLRISL